MPWKCFFTKPTGDVQRSLRRYRSSDGEKCPRIPGDYSYHTTSMWIERHEVVKNEDGYIIGLPVEDYKDDLRWPTHCECGYEYKDDDHWQVNQEEIYVADDGREYRRRDLPIGAMIDMWWDIRAKPGPEGLKLGVVLPPGGDNHLWCIDGPSSTGGGWMRTGVIPNITAAPSILTNKYHGFLQNEILTDSLSDRPNPFA